MKKYFKNYANETIVFSLSKCVSHFYFSSLRKNVLVYNYVGSRFVIILILAKSEKTDKIWILYRYFPRGNLRTQNTVHN